MTTAPRLPVTPDVPVTEWVTWLAKAGYGIDWRSDIDPPCTLGELAQAWLDLGDQGDTTLEEMKWTIEEETGEWGRGRT
jgi:hypothetical protein